MCIRDRARDVQEWLSGMTFGTARHARAIFKIVMNRAEDLEYIDHHPLGKRYIMPTAKSARQRSSDIYDPDELESIFRECSGELWEPYYILAAFGGAQRAEAIGVQAPEIEWRENERGPVSYTHLDVYKRQAWRPPASPGLGRRCSRPRRGATAPRSPAPRPDRGFCGGRSRRTARAGT